MTGMQWALEVVLVLLLSATLFHAVRLERAITTLRRDRATLERLIAGFDESTRQAEDGAERLRAAAEISGKQITRQVERANGLKDDLVFLTERGERLADLLERHVVDARQVQGFCPGTTGPAAEVMRTSSGELNASVRSKAERDLIRALRLGH